MTGRNSLVTLNNGVAMPAFGIDTAAAYFNERQVGEDIVRGDPDSEVGDTKLFNLSIEDGAEDAR